MNESNELNEFSESNELNEVMELNGREREREGEGHQPHHQGQEATTPPTALDWPGGLPPPAWL